MRSFAFHLAVYFLHLSQPALGVPLSNQDWVEAVPEIPAYKDLSSSCARDCVLNVYKLRDCKSVGCVCSENDNAGTNLIANYENARACVQENCGGGSLVPETGNAFKTICAALVNGIPDDTTTIAPVSATTTSVATLSGTTRTTVVTVSSTLAPVAPTGSCRADTFKLIKPPSYDALNGCSKFVINSCRDAFGNQNEADCGPFKTPDGWLSYEGLAKTLGSCEPYYLCYGAFFYITLTNLYNQSATFCNYKPSVNGSTDERWNQVVGVIADYCAREGFPQSNFQYGVVVPKNSTGKLDEHPSTGLGTGDKIGIGAAVGTAGLMIILSVPAFYYARKTYRSMGQ